METVSVCNQKGQLLLRNLKSKYIFVADRNYLLLRHSNRIQQILFKRVILREKILTSVEQSYWTQREM